MKVATALLAATTAVAQASDINPLILGGSIVPVGQNLTVACWSVVVVIAAQIGK
jgi:hypothetical protein